MGRKEKKRKRRRMSCLHFVDEEDVEMMISRTNWSDKDSVIQAVTKYGCLLERASVEFRLDRDVCLAAMRNRCCVRGLMHCGVIDYEIAQVAVEHNGRVLENLPLVYREIKEIVLIACESDCMSFGLLSESLRSDRDVALMAFQSGNTSVYRFLPQCLREDRDFMMEVARFAPSIVEEREKLLRKRFMKRSFEERRVRFKYLPRKCMDPKKQT